MAVKNEKLGVNTKTQRGFPIVKFKDAYATPCSIQQSSAIDFDCDGGYENPGSSYLWIGVNEPDPRIMARDAVRLNLPTAPKPREEVSGWVSYPIPEEVQCTTRMHLSRNQVAGLIERLQNWLDNGTLE